MSKITFRADDELVERVEALDASKSEVMREALRAYLDDPDGDGDSLGEALAEHVDALVDRRLAAVDGGRDVNVNIHLDAEDRSATVRGDETPRANDRETRPATGRERPAADAAEGCAQCGEPLEGDYVYCPNCGEKAARRIFCECGDELRSDWAYCPSCGRRTPPADVLEG